MTNAREKQHAFTLMQFEEVYKGRNCNANKAYPYHSPECIADHDRATKVIELISWQANVMKSDCSPELLVKFAIEILKRYG